MLKKPIFQTFVYDCTSIILNVYYYVFYFVDRLKRMSGSPIALNPGLVVLDILRSTLDQDRRRQQMSEAAAMNSELFTRVGRR